ncbi:MAG: hypothetical protein GTO18_00110 [Anaerolineales bacterium]|nr:hypothetical protein [Anaerolineales bacterium]
MDREGLAVWDSSTLRVDFITWNGERFPLLQVNSDVDPDSWETFLSPLEFQGEVSSKVVFYLEEDRESESPSEAIYIVDIKDFSITAHRLGCKVSRIHIALGEKYLSYRCFYTPLTYYIVDLEDPFIGQMRSLPVPEDDALDIVARWQNETDIVFYQSYFSIPSGIFHICLDSINDQEPMCKIYNFWIGDFSPNRKWVEIRIEDEDFPDGVGVLPAACLREKSDDCTPQWMPTEIASGKFGLYASWTPDSRHIIYVAPAYYVGETSDYWVYSVEKNEFVDQWQEVGSYKFRYIFGARPIWAPDGKHFLVEGSNAEDDPEEDGYLVSVEDGTHTLLYDGGTLLGVIRIH